MTPPAPYRIAIVGAGLMGAGLARLFGAAGWPVSIYDPHAAPIDGVRWATSLADAAADADFVIEAASEQLAIKQAIFAELASATDAILATNSSVIPVGAITADLDDATAARTIGMHFWNPPDIVPLVEVIAGPRSRADVIDRGMTMLRAAGKEPVHVRRDTVPGNRLQHALWREAMALVDEGVCSPEDVDMIVKRSFGLRLAVLGPLENADLVGLTLTRQIHDVVLPTLSRATEPSPALTQRIAAGTTFHAGQTPEKLAGLRAALVDHLVTATGGRR
jgi:3-hydroxybutyryl-CoA dehydrogenase